MRRLGAASAALIYLIRTFGIHIRSPFRYLGSIAFEGGMLLTQSVRDTPRKALAVKRTNGGEVLEVRSFFDSLEHIIEKWQL